MIGKHGGRNMKVQLILTAKEKSFTLKQKIKKFKLDTIKSSRTAKSWQRKAFKDIKFWNRNIIITRRQLKGKFQN